MRSLIVVFLICAGLPSRTLTCTELSGRLFVSVFFILFVSGYVCWPSWQHSTIESTLNSYIVSYRIVCSLLLKEPYWRFILDLPVVFMDIFLHWHYRVEINNRFVVCRCFCRQYTVLFKCVYDRLKDKCNATSSAIYTRYHTIVLERVGCGISEYNSFD